MNDQRTASVVPASVKISIRMVNRLGKMLDREQTKLMPWLDGAGQVGTFCGWLFENYVHEIKLQGGEFGLLAETVTATCRMQAVTNKDIFADSLAEFH